MRWSKEQSTLHWKRKLLNLQQCSEVCYTIVFRLLVPGWNVGSCTPAYSPQFCRPCLLRSNIYCVFLCQSVLGVRFFSKHSVYRGPSYTQARSSWAITRRTSHAGEAEYYFSRVHLVCPCVCQRVRVSVCVCRRRNRELLIRIWYNFVERCFIVNPQVTRFWCQLNLQAIFIVLYKEIASDLKTTRQISMKIYTVMYLSCTWF